MTTAPPPIVVLCTEIAVFLNAATEGTFSREFDAERIYKLPEGGENQRLAQFDTLKVFVAPAAVQTESSARVRVQDTYEVHVFVIHNIDAKAQVEELDLMTGFVHEIAEYLKRHTPESGAKWLGHTIDPIFSRELLVAENQFASTITVTYLRTRE